MPSPIAHSIAAGLLGRYFSTRPPGSAQPWRTWLLVLFFSFAPDLDVIPGVLFGDFAAFHNQWTHSLFFGVIFCLIAAPLLHWFLKTNSLRFAYSIAFTGYGIHLAMDWMTRGRGVMLGWPFRDERFMLEPPLFVGLRWSEGWWTPHHVHTLVNELSIGALFLASAILTRYIRGKIKKA